MQIVYDTIVRRLFSSKKNEKRNTWTTTTTDPVKPKWNTRQLAFSSFILCAFTRFGLDWAGKTPQTIPPRKEDKNPVNVLTTRTTMRHEEQQTNNRFWSKNWIPKKKKTKRKSSDQT